jgi:hypothetical protein
MNKLPKVEGLLSYRSDDRKLYLKKKSQWEALAYQKEVSSTVLLAKFPKLFKYRIKYHFQQNNASIRIQPFYD